MSNQNTNHFNIPPWLFRGLAFPLIVLNIWVFVFVFNAFQGIFSSFILAGFISLFLNHPISFLRRRFQFSKRNAILLVFLGFILVFLGIALILIPIIVVKFSELLNILPNWIDLATLRLNNLSEWANDSNIIDTEQILANLTQNLQNQLRALIKFIPGFVFGTLGNVLNIFFIFVLTIFFLFYGKSLLKNSLQSWLSYEIGETIQNTLYRNFNSYLLNQLILASVLTVTMIPTLLLIKAPFPLLFGLTIGIMGFIPFGAVISILGISFILCLGNFWIGLRVLIILLVVDQMIENTLPPRLLGKLTGLNPIVILLSVMVGATLGDFIGLITAVPIAATLKSLIVTFSESESEQIEQIP